MPRFAAIRRAPRTSASVAAVAALTAGLLAPASGAWAADGPGAVPGGDGWAGRNLVQTGDATPTGSARAAAADRLAAATGHPRGIDVSRYQSSSTLTSCSGPVQVGWAAVRSSGRSFAFIKATGTRSGGIAQDPCFERNWAGARAAGLYRGAYHYAIPSRTAGSAAADARFFVQVTGTMQEPGDLPPVLDLEASGGLTRAQVQAWAMSWLTTVRSLTGRQPILYTGPYFWRESVGGGSAFSAFPLWIARYASAPSVPTPWRTWTFWQSSASGRVPGVSGDVDVDTFNGTAAQLRDLAHPATVPSATASASVVYVGDPWTLTGTLRSASGALVRGETVTLYRRAGGSTVWTAVASTRTDASTGGYRFDLRPTAAASYQVRYAGGRDFAASASAVLSHAYSSRVPTTLTASVSSAAVTRRQSLQLSGALTQGMARRAVPHAALTVYRRVGTGPWTAVRQLATSSTDGGYRTTLRPLRTAVYKVAYVGSNSRLASSSPVRTVAVR